MDVYRTPDQRFDGLPGFPFEPHYTEIERLCVHHVDEGAGDPILLLHGEPTWSFLYRRMIPILAAAGHRALAPDYLGFGRSDKPTDRGFYTYDMHVSTVTALAERLDLSRITVAVQDWGGPIGLRFAAENAERVARLVVLNTGLMFPSERWRTPAFLRWRTFAERTGLELPVGFIVQGGTVTDLPPEVIAGYEAPFPTPESKTGAAMFPLLVPIAEGIRASRRCWPRATRWAGGRSRRTRVRHRRLALPAGGQGGGDRRTGPPVPGRDGLIGP